MRWFAVLLVWIGVLGIAGSRAARADPPQAFAIDESVAADRPRRRVA
jgi:hypothetical protein